MRSFFRDRDRTAVLLLLLCLFGMGIAALLGGSGVFSEWERRYLKDAPQMTSLTDWTFNKDTEDYLADHVPFRRALVAADAAANVLTGRRTEQDTWLVHGAVIERPVRNADIPALEKRLARLARFADPVGVPWLLLTPPTHGFLLRSSLSPLLSARYDGEATVLEALWADEHAVVLPGAFAASPETVYYRTDHHWTLAGAYQAYLALAGRLGFEAQPPEAFDTVSFPGFMGTTLSRSGLPPIMSDTLVCASPAAPVRLTVRDGEGKEYDRLIFPEAARSYDGYAVYLNGNHGLLTVENSAAPQGTLLVYKDSFANCLLPLLSAHYRTVIAADARYMEGGFSDALALAGDSGGPDAILFVYSLDSLINDTEILRKLSR